ncbi:MAG: META domain-containing protein [Duncaniella sp.]|nr:META domain-containing protein [Muribaculum sp.]MCM1254676.1 META domain-containing protein [Duncaniella sp.]
MKTLSLFITTLSVTALLSGCNILSKHGTTVNSGGSVVKTTIVTDNPEIPSVPVTDEFIGQWSVVEILGEKVTVNGENHPKITFQRLEDMPDALMVIGFNGCNYLNGTWKVTTSGIAPQGELISTMRSCPDAPYEFTMNKALNESTTYSFGADSSLELKNSNDVTVMKLRKRQLSFLNGAWQVDAIKGVKVPSSANVKIVIDVDDCKVHGNAGCNLLNGEITVNLDKSDGLEFKNLATTRMACPDMATEQQFLLALEMVDTATMGGDENEAVMKDAQGTVVLSMHRISADELKD